MARRQETDCGTPAKGEFGIKGKDASKYPIYRGLEQR